MRVDREFRRRSFEHGAGFFRRRMVIEDQLHALIEFQYLFIRGTYLVDQDIHAFGHLNQILVELRVT